MFSTAEAERPDTGYRPLRAVMRRRPARALRKPGFLESFRAISLEELNAKAAMFERLDNKYVVREAVLGRAMPELGRHFDILDMNGKRVFTYETCYFDDEKHSNYFDHHRRRRQRFKVRTRTYTDAGLCFVEVKLKDKRGITVKKRLGYALHKYGTLDDAGVAHVRRSHEAQYGIPFERALEPVLQMSYRRTTLVAKAGGERMTIDSRIRFGDDDSATALDEALFIVETKSAHGHGVADAILRRHHQHPSKGCSKYCVGMSATGSVERCNRFRPVLARLGLLPAPGGAERAGARGIGGIGGIRAIGGSR